QPVLLPATPVADMPSPEPVVFEGPSASAPSRPPPKSTEPPAWATAVSPGGALTVLARDHEVVLRRPDRTVKALGPGKPIAVAFGSWLDADTGWVECWSIPKRRKLATYRAPVPIGATRFAPDGSMLVIGGWNGQLAWLTLPDGKLVATRQMPKDLVAAAAFSP